MAFSYLRSVEIEDLFLRYKSDEEMEKGDFICRSCEQRNRDLFLRNKRRNKQAAGRRRGWGERAKGGSSFFLIVQP
jgi:hypothetical protein